MSSALKNLLVKGPDTAAFAHTDQATGYDISGNQTVALQASVTTTTPSNKTFTDTDVNTGTDTVTITAHGFSAGLAVTLTSTGTLPAGLATATTYYLIVPTANSVKFATSLVNALAGTAINITSQGTAAATNTVVVTAISGSILLRGSLDNTNWFDLTPTQALGSQTQFVFDLSFPGMRYVALGVTLTAGSVTIIQSVLGKGIA